MDSLKNLLIIFLLIALIISFVTGKVPKSVEQIMIAEEFETIKNRLKLQENGQIGFEEKFKNKSNMENKMPQTKQNPRKTAYDEVLARKLLNLSVAAYSNIETMQKECVERTFPSSEDWKLAKYYNGICDDLNNTCAFIVAQSARRKEIVVAFRGTIGPWQLGHEILQSIAEKHVGFFGIGKVNVYFADALLSLWDHLEDYLAEAGRKKYKAIFTGHSLGGALASLAAAKSVNDEIFGSNDVMLYNFGAPRVGAPDYAARHDQLVPRSFRIVNQGDLVPQLPPCHHHATNNIFWWTLKHWFLGQHCDPEQSYYYHHGVEIWYPNGFKAIESGVNEDNTKFDFVECVGSPANEDPNCRNSLTHRNHSVDDHKHYFGHQVSSYGKAGCSAKRERYLQWKEDNEAEEVSETMMKSLFI